MPSYAPKEQKQASDGQTVTLYRDSTGAYFVGSPGDPDCFPQPMGAFITRQAARAWADRRFPGGQWGAAPAEARLPAGTHLRLRPIPET